MQQNGWMKIYVCDGVNKKIVRAMFREFVSFIVRL